MFRNRIRKTLPSTNRCRTVRICSMSPSPPSASLRSSEKSPLLCLGLVTCYVIDVYTTLSCRRRDWKDQSLNVGFDYHSLLATHRKRQTVLAMFMRSAKPSGLAWKLHCQRFEVWSLFMWFCDFGLAFRTVAGAPPPLGLLFEILTF